MTDTVKLILTGRSGRGSTAKRRVLRWHFRLVS
jgi:hypothetical protein